MLYFFSARRITIYIIRIMYKFEAMVDLTTEIKFRTSRSSGPGGQHVNKVESRVELMFDVENSEFLEKDQKAIIFEKLKNRISNDGILRLQCDESRSQAKNREIVIKRFLVLVERALKPVKKRKPTRPTKSSIEKRLKIKKQVSEKKSSRKLKSDD